LKQGDVLRITYHESIAYQVSKAGQAKPGVARGHAVGADRVRCPG
jgi:hypothetical protein